MRLHRLVGERNVMDGIAVLGPALIIADAVALPIPSRRQQLLLAMLVARFDQPVAGSALTEALWGSDLPQHPAAALQSQVFRLRRQLTPAGVRIDTVGDGYRLDAERAAIDATRFEDLVAGADEHRHDPEVALELLEQALSLWRGRAFDDVADDPTIIGHATRLEELRADVSERRARLLIDVDRAGEAAGAMEVLSDEHPFREQPVAIRMRALARLGRHADALTAYSEFRTRLGETLGLETSPDLRAVEREILTHDQPSRPRIGLPGNSLVGREAELAGIAAHLRSGRVVTLTGPGGVGKTRLALHAAVDDADRHPDGVWLCELAGITSSEPVATAVAAALRLEHSAGRSELERIV
jgi:DNA-binding SARP family transcriptional activator